MIILQKQGFEGWFQERVYKEQSWGGVFRALKSLRFRFLMVPVHSLGIGLHAMYGNFHLSW